MCYTSFLVTAKQLSFFRFLLKKQPFCFSFFIQILRVNKARLYFYRVKFSFTADVDGLPVTFTAERIYRSRQAERYRLTIAGSSYTIVVQSNRPLLEGKITAKTAQWYVAEGDANDKKHLDAVYKQLEKALENTPATLQGTLNFISHL